MAELGGTLGTIAIGHNFKTGQTSYTIIHSTSDPKTQAANDLDMAIKSLEIVSKEERRP